MIENNLQEWEIVSECNGLFEVSNFGAVKRTIKGIKEVRNLSPKRILNQRITVYGYMTVTVRLNSGWKTKFVHRIVAEAFIENPYNKSMVNHIDGDKQNNHVSNLEWVTHQENVTHYHKYLRPKRKDTQQKGLIIMSEASRLLTGDRTSIRSTYTGNKWKQAVNELKQFERDWTKKHAPQHIK